MEKKYVEISTALQSRALIPKVKRWDARTRTTSVWDGLRKDSELFSQRGNCLVHFYGKGHSRRGPSLKIPLERIYSARFASLFTLFQTEISRGGLSNDNELESLNRQCDLYIPAPDESSRKESFTWHITTRNFFAFVLGRPLVGSSLGEAMTQLRQRLDVFRPNDARNHEDIMAYFEKVGYLNFAHCPDYALALLNYAEQYKLHELWVDAFVHCVGMNERLNRSPEFHYVSCVTHALITRAFLEMDLHLGRVTKSLGNFLEEDFSPAYFGASAGTRGHLDRFRTFLHEYYVEKFGYWPPPKGDAFSKSLYKSMYFDFRSLYDFLVDLDSSDSLMDQKPASGGICVLQNVKAFDERHKFIPLPHPHPLLPQEPQTQSQRTLRSFKIGARLEPYAELREARICLASATNLNDVATSSAPIVKAYQRFEREWRPDEKVSITDARKARWLLIYGTLQMLISVIRAPKEVRITETTYPLCCLVTGTPPWQAGLKALNSTFTPSVLPANSRIKALEVVAAVSVHPDCDSEKSASTTTLLSATAPSRTRRRSFTPSIVSSVRGEQSSTPTPSSRGSIFRSASIRSVNSITSVMSSISQRSSTRRRSGPPSVSAANTPYDTAPGLNKSSKSATNFREIVVKGYGNGLAEATNSAPHLVPSELSNDILPEIVVSQQSPPRSPPRVDNPESSPTVERPRSSRSIVPKPKGLVLQAHGRTKIPEPSRTPLMDSFHVQQALPGLEDLSDSPSTHSASSVTSALLAPGWSSSRSASTHSATFRSTVTEATTSKRTSAQEEDLSPVSPSLTDESAPSLPLSPTSPIDSAAFHEPHIFSKKSMDLPMVVDIEEMQTYQPTGVPSLDTPVEDDEEFPARIDQKRWSVASKRNSFVGAAGLVEAAGAPLKSSLRRSMTANKSRRSVRIKDDPTHWSQKFRSNTMGASVYSGPIQRVATSHV